MASMLAQGPHESPFTGLPAGPAPVLAVKIGNTKAARPHAGVEDADLVYVEQVEGGLSRLMAVYAAAVPATVGPVRSAREHNVTQLRAFGRPALAYSGAQKGVENLLQASPLYPLSNDTFPDAYRRHSGREAPHNLYLTPRTVLDAAPGASLSADIGLTFSDTPPGGGTPMSRADVHYPSTVAAFTWSEEERRWLASFDGEPAMAVGGVQLGGPTVVVQQTEMPLSDYQDPTDTTPRIETMGTGRATVLRDGRAYDTSWRRESETGGTVFIRGDGTRMPFARGQVWIAYEKR